jgi:hypothetical protein
MLQHFLESVYPFCFTAIGGEDNDDVDYVLFRRPNEVNRESFFGEALWANRVSGVSRKSAETFWRRLPEEVKDFTLVAGLSDEQWLRVLEGLYPLGIADREWKKWSAMRTIASLLVRFPGEEEFGVSSSPESLPRGI